MSTNDTTQDSEANSGDSDAEKTEESEPLRAQELELWDRVLQRWDKHVGRQAKIVVSVVTFVILLAGFLGLRSLDQMVEDSVEAGVTEAIGKSQKDIDARTKSLSDFLSDNLAKMAVDVSTLGQESKRARDLVDQMQEQSKKFEELKTKYSEQLTSMETVSRRVAGLQSELNTSLASLERITEDINRVDKIASETAREAAAANQDDNTSLGAERPTPPELGTGVLDALGVRQVPTLLAKAGQDRRTTYLLTTSVFVDKTVAPETASVLLDSIVKVTYTLSEQWFKNNVIERSNRQDNFQFTVTVWGVTSIEAKAEFAGKSEPICWTSLMSLNKEIEFQREPCSAS